MARRSIVCLNADFMAQLLHGHSMSEVTTNFPTDARIVGAGWDENLNCIRLAVESSTFDDIPDGYFAPNFEVIATSHFSELEAVLSIFRPEPSATT